MKGNGVDRLLRDWDEVAGTARTPAPSPQRRRITATGTANLPLLLVAAVVVAGIAIVGGRLPGAPAGTGSPASASPTARPSPSASAIVASGPPIAVATGQDFRFTLSSDRAVYTEGEQIRASASLEYLGARPSITVYEAFSPVVFSVHEIGGEGRSVEGGTRLSCGSMPMEPHELRTFSWAKSGGFTPGEPDDAFAEWYLSSGDALVLPPGRWRLTGDPTMGLGACGGTGPDLAASVEVTVVPTTKVVVSCGRVEPLACGEALRLAADEYPAAARAARRVVVDRGCPPDSICRSVYRFNVFVVYASRADALPDVAMRVVGDAGPERVMAPQEQVAWHVRNQLEDPAVDEPAAIAVPTGKPVAPGPIRSCQATTVAGVIVAHDGPATGWTLAVRATGDEVLPVRWPHGWEVRIDALGFALVDVDDGVVVAHAGDWIEVWGAQDEDGWWSACGSFTVNPSATDP